MQVTDEMVEAARRIRDCAMKNMLAARIPESGHFGAIAQDADWLVDALTAALAAAWRPISEAPRTGERILVFYDHESDPYHETETCLTPYGAHSEGGGFLDGRGICVAQWVDGWHEPEAEYGSGYWMPGWWFAHHNGDAELAVAPTHWMPLPEPPKGVMG